MRVCKQFSFDASHQLVGHFGKCANLHGHTYKVEVSLAGDTVKEGSSAGMVVDFYHVKKYAGEIIDRLDHAFLMKGDEPALDVVTTKRVYFGFRTTAENMAKFLTWALGVLMQPYGRIDTIRLWETPTGYAECDFYEIFSDEEVAAYQNVTFIDGDKRVTLKEIIDGQRL